MNHFQKLVISKSFSPLWIRIAEYHQYSSFNTTTKEGIISTNFLSYLWYRILLVGFLYIFQLYWGLLCQPHQKHWKEEKKLAKVGRKSNLPTAIAIKRTLVMIATPRNILKRSTPIKGMSASAFWLETTLTGMTKPKATPNWK